MAVLPELNQQPAETSSEDVRGAVVELQRQVEALTCLLVLSCAGSGPSNEEAESVQSDSAGDTEGGAPVHRLHPSAPYKAEETSAPTG